MCGNESDDWMELEVNSYEPKCDQRAWQQHKQWKSPASGSNPNQSDYPYCRGNTACSLSQGRDASWHGLLLHFHKSRPYKYTIYHSLSSRNAFGIVVIAGLTSIDHPVQGIKLLLLSQVIHCTGRSFDEIRMLKGYLDVHTVFQSFMSNLWF